MPSPNIQISLTHELSWSFEKIYQIAKEESNSNERGFTRCGLLAAPLAVTIWEAFFNERLLSKASDLWFSDEVFKKAQNIANSVERLEIELKTILIPEILFGKTYNKSEQPFQDFSKLVKIRNSIIHYKMHDYPKNHLQDLRSRKILLAPKDNEEMSWTMEICSLKFVFWCHNTIALMSKKLSAFYPTEPDLRIRYLKP